MGADPVLGQDAGVDGEGADGDVAPWTSPVPAVLPPLVPRSPLTMSHAGAAALIVADPDTDAVRPPLTCTAYVLLVSWTVTENHAAHRRSELL